MKYNGGPLTAAALTIAGGLQDRARAAAATAHYAARRSGLDDESALDYAIRAAGDTCAAAGLEVLGIGSTRVAVALPSAPEVAFKVEFTAQRANIDEAAMWLGLTDHQANHVAPVLLLSADGVLVQRRADPVGPQLTHAAVCAALDPVTGGQTSRDLARDTRAAQREHGPEILELQRRLGWQPDQPTGFRANNYGRLDGRLVLLDLRSNSDPLTPPDRFAEIRAELVERMAAGHVPLDRADPPREHA